MVNHKDISRYRGVSVATVQGWGRAGLLGPVLIKSPAYYGWDALKLSEQIEDGRVKLADKQIKQIRRRSEKGESNISLARAFGVHESHISRIVRNERRIAS